MSTIAVEVHVTPRPGILDPQGKAIHHALQGLEFPGVEEVRVGKLIRLELEADSPDEALARAEEMCHKLLANPVIEDFEVNLAGDDGAEG